jgi:vacuolar-type H+-ATPase subunit H
MMDVKAIRQEAEKEVQEEKAKKAKEAIKSLLKERDAAQTILNNIERKIEDTLATINEGNVVQPSSKG